MVVEGWASGQIHLPDADGEPEPGEVAFAAQAGPGFPPTWIGPFLGTWAHFHGMVTLELLNQLDWVYPDPEAFYRDEVDRTIAAWG